MSRGAAVIVAMCAGLAAAMPCHAVVFINEVAVNPAGTFDDTHEFIELKGTPGKKLDGYAIAFLNGTLAKYYPLGSITVPQDNLQEIDEFFSLDGLSLGKNGILLLGIGPATNYIGRSPDANIRATWKAPAIWNGLLDTPGKLENDGSNTMVLIRNRPGRTQADPANPAGLRWGKDITHDGEIITPVMDPQTMMMVDQFGDGEIDDGGPSNFPSSPNTLDLKGKSTPSITDDLELVDEVSYEHERGWEYEVDERHVDLGSVSNGLPYRHVHALDDPQGFNPDALTRVDYRTKGDGWIPAPGAIGEMSNGNNWQDSATEQWVRGETVSAAGPTFFYSNAANINPDSIQPYLTNVPSWLNDGIGADYNFLAANTYKLTPGAENPLATNFVPGDSDRDGDCDADDIAKIAAVFGDANWIFSNSYAAAPETDGGDPSTQTRPWDVDGTGDNGIEPSDLQWSLNFQGDTTGRIVGVDFSGTGATPAGQGVYLNPNTGVSVAVTTSLALPPGRTPTTLLSGDQVTVQVQAQVTAGANTLADQQNGVMQFVNDLQISSGGVLRVVSVTPAAPYAKTRASLETLQGVSGDLGVTRVNGYSTSFVQGLGAASAMYDIVLEAIGPGSASLTLARSAEPRFVASTPQGVKVGHTNTNGNPATSSYPAPLAFTVIVVPPCCVGNADKISPGQVNFNDINSVIANWLGNYPITGPGDANCDGIVNFDDINSVIANWLNPCS